MMTNLVATVVYPAVAFVAEARGTVLSAMRLCPSIVIGGSLRHARPLLMLLSAVNEQIYRSRVKLFWVR